MDNQSLPQPQRRNRWSGCRQSFSWRHENDRDRQRWAQEISHIGADRLVPLKAHAWLNKKAQIENGVQVDSRDIKKHFRDVILLSVGLTEGMTELPERMALDLTSFLSQVPAELASNPQGYKGVDGDRLIKIIREAFSLN